MKAKKMKKSTKKAAKVSNMKAQAQVEVVRATYGMEVNPGVDPAHLHVGQKIKLPVKQ